MGNCLNDNAIIDVIEVIDFFETFDSSKVTKIFSKCMEVFTGIQSCSIEESITDVTTFCSVHPENCTSQSLLDNLTKNMFILMGKFTDLTTILQDFPAQTAQSLFQQTSQIGNVVGTVLRIASGFQPTA